MRRVGFFASGMLVLMLLLISGCASMTEYGKLESSAREYYTKGNYDVSVYEVVKSLRINPEYDKSRELIKEVFPKAIDSHLGTIDEAKQGNDKFKWDTVVSEYEELISLNKAVRSLPTLQEVTSGGSAKSILLGKEKSTANIEFKFGDYSQALSEAKANAAEGHYLQGKRISSSDHRRAGSEFRSAEKYISGYKDALTLGAEGYYQSGLRLMQKDDVESQKQAAKEFKTVTEFVSGYKDSNDLYERARKSGIKRIAIIPFQNKSGKDNYGAVADEVVDGIVSNVMNDSSATEFLEIISRDQLAQVMNEQKLGMTGFIDDKSAIEMGKILGVHEILTGTITRINITPERTVNKNYPNQTTECRWVITGKDHKGRDVGEAVCDIYHKATVTQFTRTAGASLSGSYKIIDVKTAKLKDTRQFNEDYKFEYTWARFSGDEKGLSDESAALCRKDEKMAPVEEEMVNETVKKLLSSLSRTFKEYAR